MLSIDIGMFETLAIAIMVIYFGRFCRQKAPILVKYCIPESVVGATIMSLVTFALYMGNVIEFNFDTSINSFFYNIFFATGGASASVLLLKKGGVMVIIFAVLAAIMSLIQNILAVGVGTALGMDPLMALMLGSTPLTGGHGSAASFGELAENAGAIGASGMAATAATFGLVSGCIMGGPIGRRLVKKYNLRDELPEGTVVDFTASEGDKPRVKAPIDSARSTRACFYMILACGFGEFAFKWINQILPEKINLPIHVMCLVGGILVRLILDLKKKGDEDLYETFSIVGEISLAIFISVSIMTMKLWQLIDLMGSMAVVLTLQLIVMYIFCTQVTFRLCGKNYDGAVIATGHSGFALGATAVAMASMTSVCQKYGYSKLAFFIVPLVGGFLGDVSNAFIVSYFIELCSNMQFGG